jgi:glycosyltransferase involved in cell wall biosynthesis
MTGSVSDNMSTKIVTNKNLPENLIRFDKQSLSIETMRPLTGLSSSRFISMEDVTFVIPAMNEENNLIHVLPTIPAEAEVILIDGHSKDNTIEAAKMIRPDIQVFVQPGRGKGNAMKYGFHHASRGIIVTFDADGSFNIGEITEMVHNLKSGYHLVKGSRFKFGGRTDDMPFIRYLGNRIFVLLTNLLFGSKYTDLAYGLHAFRREILEVISLECDGFEIDTELYIKTKRAGFRVLETPSVENKRLHGKGKLRSIPDGWRILKTIVKVRF